MAARHRRTYVTIALLVALVLVTALTAACSAQATSGALAASSTSGNGAAASGSPATSGGSAAAGKAGANDDWGRIAQALAWMQADPPTKPVVVLLGGSAARESTISDASWRSQIVSDGGPATLAWNMGSHNRTMAQNLAIVKALPKDIHAVVFVGINLGSFTSTQKAASISLPSPAPSAGEISLQQPHQYGVKKTGILSTSQKQAMVQEWLSKRYSVYKANFSRNATLLAELIKLCQTRGYKPVLFELPRNTQVIGSSLNAPSAKFRDKCKSLAATNHIPWVSFVSAANLPNKDFYDIWHLVEPGRTIWQKLLSAKTAALLKQYGYDGGS